jgi:hypothetical protein
MLGTKEDALAGSVRVMFQGGNTTGEACTLGDALGEDGRPVPPRPAVIVAECTFRRNDQLRWLLVLWRLLGATGSSLQRVSRHWRGGRLRVPEILDRLRHGGGRRPLTYPNDRARRPLGWLTARSPAETIADALH